MTDPTNTMEIMVGEIRGQLREIVHATNNNSSKLDQVGKQLAKLEDLPTALGDLTTRVAALEAEKSKGDGAKGVIAWLLQSPLIGWIATAAIAFWAFIERKHG